MKKLLASLLFLSFAGPSLAVDFYCFKEKTPASPTATNVKLNDIYGPFGHPEMWSVVELSVNPADKTAQFSFRSNQELLPANFRECSASGDCRVPGIKRTPLKFNREADDRLVFQTESERGRVDVFTLFKETGELRVGVWREVETETRPDTTFRFRRVIEKSVELSHVSVFKCE